MSGEIVPAHDLIDEETLAEIYSDGYNPFGDYVDEVARWVNRADRILPTSRPAAILDVMGTLPVSLDPGLKYIAAHSIAKAVDEERAKRAEAVAELIGDVEQHGADQ